MSFDIVASSFRVVRTRRSPVAEAARVGGFAGAAVAMFALVGAYVAMDGRPIVEGVLTLSGLFTAAAGLTAGFVAGRPRGGARPPRLRLADAGLAGAVAGALVAAVLVVIATVNLRATLVNASPQLVRKLGFGLPLGGAAALWVAGGLALGLAGGVLAGLRAPDRLAIMRGLAAAAALGLFQDLVTGVLVNLPGGDALGDALYGTGGLRPLPAALVCVAAMAASRLLLRTRPAGRAAGPRSGLLTTGLVGLVLIVFPLVAGDFLAQVVMMIGLYVLMGMGLNIELGLAGLVDMGFVAFFAVGAYTIALLCAGSPHGPHLSFWLGLPAAVVAAATAGALFGLPVLRVRGDYLAMATLGLGEIVRVLVLSDALTPWLGGPQGIIDIPKPELFGARLSTPTSLYYLALLLAALVGVISVNLRRSRVGRAWEAIREDEEVAQALGIDLVACKLLAYTIGAAFAGAAGAVFAVLVGSVFPSSFQLLVSLNVLAILVVGGLGSLPGVVVGTVVLIGLPEMFRELGDYRYLFYGVALVAVMHWRAEGLWPATAPRSARP